MHRYDGSSCDLELGHIQYILWILLSDLGLMTFAIWDVSVILVSLRLFISTDSMDIFVHVISTPAGWAKQQLKRWLRG